MSDNLNFLRQTYCRPGTINAKPMPELFPLERGGEQGRILCAKTPKKALDLKEFDPRGLEQSYRDEATGAELPVFAKFNLEGDHRCAFEIAVGSVQTTASSPQYSMGFFQGKRVKRHLQRKNSSTTSTL